MSRAVIVFCVTFFLAIVSAAQEQIDRTERRVVFVKVGEIFHKSRGVNEWVAANKRHDRLCFDSRQKIEKKQKLLRNRWGRLLDYDASWKDLIDRRRRFDRLDREIGELATVCNRSFSANVAPVIKTINNLLREIEENSFVVLIYYSPDLMAQRVPGQDVLAILPEYDRTRDVIRSLNKSLASGKPSLVVKGPVVDVIATFDEDEFLTLRIGPEWRKTRNEYLRRVSTALRSRPPGQSVEEWESENLPSIKAEFPRELFDGLDLLPAFASENKLGVIMARRSVLRIRPELAKTPKRDVTREYGDFYARFVGGNQ